MRPENIDEALRLKILLDEVESELSQLEFDKDSYTAECFKGLKFIAQKKRDEIIAKIKRIQ